MSLLRREGVGSGFRRNEEFGWGILFFADSETAASLVGSFGIQGPAVQKFVRLRRFGLNLECRIAGRSNGRPPLKIHESREAIPLFGQG